MRKLSILITIILLVSLTYATYYTTCNQSLTRTCVYGTNMTDRLLNLKKGGSNLPAMNTYDPNFFICQEYGYNCGYLERQNDFLTIAHGMQLNMTYSQLLNVIPSDTTLTNLIKPYLNMSGQSAQCLSNFFPLNLTDTQSNTAMNGFLSRLSVNLSAIYATKKANTSPSWSSLNINLITPVIQIAKMNMNGNFVGSTFWNNFLTGNYTAMSNQLKQNYSNTSTLVYLRSAYSIDTVIQSCDKYQSINFLVDESVAVGSSNFNYVKTFLTNYVTQTNDDPSLMSINYYDATFDNSVGYGNSKSTILSAISAKSCRCTGSGNLGNAINNTITKINAGGFSKGLPKILMLLIGSTSLDNVFYAAQYARSLGITIIAVGIGSGYSNTQLLQAAYTQSNLIYVGTYSLITSFNSQLPNLLAHQYQDIALNSSLTGTVRSTSYPNFYRIPRDSNGKNTYYMKITFGVDPTTQPISVLQSHYDPFPDQYSSYNWSQVYRTSIYSYQYYITPVAGQTVAIKKDQTAIKFLYYTYISIAGNSLTYNITINNCTTSNCTEEIAAALKIGSLNFNNYNSNINENGDSNLSENDLPSNVVDPSIFLQIGGGIVALALGTYATISGLRQFRESPDQPIPQADNNMETNHDLEANQEDNLIRPQNSAQLQNSQRHNHRRSHHHRSEHRSNGFHSRNGHKKQQSKKSSWDDDSECYVEDKKKLQNKKNQEKKSNKSDKQSRKSDQRQSNKSHKSQIQNGKKKKQQKKKENTTEKQHQKKKENTPEKQQQKKKEKTSEKQHQKKKENTPEKQQQKKKEKTSEKQQQKKKEKTPEKQQQKKKEKTPEKQQQKKKQPTPQKQHQKRKSTPERRANKK